jgi:small subunit ribosomal protein S18
MADHENDREVVEAGETAERPQREGQEDRRGGRRAAAPGQRQGPVRRKACQFCVDKVNRIDYKDVALLRQFISERGRIHSRRKTATCAKHQRMLAKAIKRARHIALLPYTAEHVRMQNV